MVKRTSTLLASSALVGLALTQSTASDASPRKVVVHLQIPLPSQSRPLPAVSRTLKDLEARFDGAEQGVELRIRYNYAGSREELLYKEQFLEVGTPRIWLSLGPGFSATHPNIECLVRALELPQCHGSRESRRSLIDEVGKAVDDAVTDHPVELVDLGPLIWFSRGPAETREPGATMLVYAGDKLATGGVSAMGFRPVAMALNNVQDYLAPGKSTENGAWAGCLLAGLMSDFRRTEHIQKAWPHWYVTNSAVAVLVGNAAFKSAFEPEQQRQLLKAIRGAVEGVFYAEHASAAEDWQIQLRSTSSAAANTSPWRELWQFEQAWLAQCKPWRELEATKGRLCAAR
jgi:hypothetical protein